MTKLSVFLIYWTLALARVHSYYYPNVTKHIRLKRYNLDYDLQWQSELRMRETELLREFIQLQTEPEKLKEHQYYRKLPPEARHSWFYQEVGICLGLFSALSLFAIHHVVAIIFYILSWLCKKRQLYVTAGKLRAPHRLKTAPHYEELQLVPSKDLKLEVYAVTPIPPRASDYVQCKSTDSIENLIRETSFYSIATTTAKSRDFDQTSVEGILPFSQIGIEGPYGERIIQRGRPLRDPLPGEAMPIVFDIDEIPFSVIGQNGFAGLSEIVKNNTVIIKTEKTANGYLRGYMGGRFTENKD